MADKNIANKNSDSLSQQTNNEYKEQNIKYNLSKFEYDLYHEEDDVPNPVISIKRICQSGQSGKNEKWKIIENDKVQLVIDGLKLSKKDREFLRTVDGVNFLISQFKIGINSFNHLKNELKKKLK